MDNEQYIESNLSVGTMKISNKYEIFTEEEVDIINNKIPELDERVGIIEDEIEEINSSLEQKANLNEFIKKGNVDLDEMTERTLQAIQGGEGTNFELLSVPRDKSVTYEKTSFLNVSYINRINPSRMVKGYLGTNGVLQGSAGYTSEFIEVNVGEVFTGNYFGTSGIWSSWFFDSSKSPISVIPSLTFTVPDGVSYVRLTYSNSNSQSPETYNFMLVEGEKLPETYIPYEPIVELDKYFKNTINSLIDESKENELRVFKEVYKNKIHTYSEGKINPTTGIKETPASLNSSEFIEILPNTIYTTNSADLPNFSACYNEDESYLSPFIDNITSVEININGVSCKKISSKVDRIIKIRLSFSKSITPFLVKGDNINDVIGTNIEFNKQTYKEDIKKELGTTSDLLNGLIWNVLGDSITDGMATTNTYHNIISSQTGVIVNNYGISGSRITRDERSGQEGTLGVEMCTRYSTMTDNADIITVFGGINDANNKLPIGTFEDRVKTTLYGAMHILCQGLHKKYIGKKIGFITPLNYGNEAHKPYIDCIKEVCAYYSIPCLDMWANGLVITHIDEVKQVLCPDGLHPNENGHAVLARKIRQFLYSL